MIFTVYREFLIFRAQRRIKHHDVEGGIELLKWAARNPGRSTRLWVILYHAYLRADNPEAAEKSILRALEIKPDNPTYHMLLGILYYDTERYPLAKREIEHCLTCQPDNQLARNYLALTLYQNGKTDEALYLIDEAGLSNNKELLSRFSLVFENELIHNPERFPEIPPEQDLIKSWLVYRLYNSLKGKTLLGKIARFFLLRRCYRHAERHMRYGNPGGAVNTLKFVLNILPADTEALSGLGIALHEMGKYEEARMIFQGLMDEGESDPLLLVYLGLCYMKLEHFNTAIVLFERVAENQLEDYSANYYAGICHLRLGDKKTALKSFEKAYNRYFIDTSEQCLDKLIRRVLGTDPERPAPPTT